MYIGQSIPHNSSFFELQFVENPGMAFGWMLPGDSGKLALSCFRIVAVIAIAWYMKKLRHSGAHRGLLICVAMIMAGAIGNIIDSAFYGLVFDQGMAFDELRQVWMNYSGLAVMGNGGYTSFLMGNVVDMFHFTARVPEWLPFIEGTPEIFPPVFNVADSSIFFGVAIIIIRQKTFFGKKKGPEEPGPESAAEALPPEELPS